VLPIGLDVRRRSIVVAGRGAGAQSRYQFARDSGAERLRLYVIDRDGWACTAEAALHERLPVQADLIGASLVFVAGLSREDSSRIARDARAAGALVNVEDQPELCDFHVPATVRRGELVLTASTGGKAPGLAKRVGAHLREAFGPDWVARTRKVIDARARWRGEGRSAGEIARLTNELIEREGWLAERVPA